MTTASITFPRISSHHCMTGKTTMLYRMKLGEVVTTIPTIGLSPNTITQLDCVCMQWEEVRILSFHNHRHLIGFNVETVDNNSVNMTIWDVGGRDKVTCYCFIGYDVNQFLRLKCNFCS